MQTNKLLGAIAVASTFIFGAACTDPVAAQPTKQPSAVTKQVRFRVDGMTCDSCNVTVKVAAEKVNGVSKAGASHAKKSAWAVYDPAKTNSRAIAAAITKAGYPATVTVDQ